MGYHTPNERFFLNLMLLRACSDSAISHSTIGVRALNSLELSRLMVLRGLRSRQDIFFLVNVAEQEVL
jgi:hypothetical protein